jgi:hypothetical protein
MFINTFLFVIYLARLFQWLRLHSVQWAGDMWIMNWKGCRSRWSWPNWKYYSSIAYGDWRKPRETSVRITGLRADIWTLDLPKTKQEWKPLDYEFLFDKYCPSISTPVSVLYCCCYVCCDQISDTYLNFNLCQCSTFYSSVSQTVISGPPVVRDGSPGGPQAVSEEKHCKNCIRQSSWKIKSPTFLTLLMILQ